jgi:hypothetical protein
MTSLQQGTTPRNSPPLRADNLVAYLLAELRAARRRAQLAADDLTAIALALRDGLITPYQAIAHIEEADAFRFLGELPPELFNKSASV